MASQMCTALTSALTQALAFADAEADVIIAKMAANRGPLSADLEDFVRRTVMLTTLRLFVEEPSNGN